MRDTSSDHKIYAELKQLLDLQRHAMRLDLSPKHAIRSLLPGRHASNLRGQGFSFEELRAYRVGDDIRSLDWKVTNRTRKPHVRVYSEERERDVLLLVDQRSTMFFGSRQYMKSVTAAELAALAVWNVVSIKDRIGAIVFNEHSIEKIKPQRSHASAMQILHRIITFNHQLNAQQNNQKGDSLDRVLQQAEQLCRRDSLVIIISDMHGWTQETLNRIKRIKSNNDLMVSLIRDPLEQELPELPQLVASDGQWQIEVDTRSKSLLERFASRKSENTDNLKSALSKYGIPLVMLDTLSPVYQQLHGELNLNKQPPNASYLQTRRLKIGPKSDEFGLFHSYYLSGKR